MEKNNEDKEITFSGTVNDLLKMLRLNPQEVIVSKNGTIVVETEELKDTDSVMIYSVISGG